MKTNLSRSMTIRHIKALKEIKELDISPYVSTRSEDSYLLVEDPHPDSDFYFSVYDVDTTSSSGTTYYTLAYKPQSDTDISEAHINIKSGDFKTFFKAWTNRIEQYSTLLEESLQDSIIEGYEDEYFSDFDLLDEDADTHSYTQHSQESIDNFLAKVAERLDKYKSEESISEEVKEEIDVLLNDINHLRATQARKTKRQVFKSVINIIARSRKAAPKVAWEIGIEVVKTLLVDAATDPQKYLDAAKNFLDS